MRAFEEKLADIPSIRDIKIEKARRNFWEYCKAVDGDFYNDDRDHLVILCTTLNNFYFRLPLDSSGKVYNNLIISIPPRFGKTRTLIHFADWVLGKDNNERIISGSYNDDTASDFSKFARDEIIKEKLDDADIVFSDIFPETTIKKGSSSHSKWALEGQHFNYMGVGIGGSVTSKGATIQIIDDLVKGADEALNQNYLDKAWLWYSSTFISRTEPTGKLPLKIMCMTRWAKGDPCGKLLELQPDKWHVVEMEAKKPDGEMLCKDFLSEEMYLDIKEIMLDEIFQANYHSKPMDIKGRLYKRFKTYRELPTNDEGELVFFRIGNYTDTADEGADFLSSGTFLENDGYAYMLDVYYTDEGKEITEPEQAKRLNEFRVNISYTESNSGGRGFARNVKRILKDDLKNTTTVVTWFHQSQNKKSRIFSQSANVQKRILMPIDWVNRWPEFATAVSNYSKKGKNQHDDGPDMLTGIVEKMDSNSVNILRPKK